MLTNLRMRDAITIRDRMDLHNYEVSDQRFDELQANGQHHLLLESWEMSDFESLYFYDTDLDLSVGMLLEAITTSRARISQTMRAFVRSLNQALTGTGISAGVSEGASVSDGSRVLGGAEIGKARRSGSIALLPAQIPLSDGQTVTIVFHSPTGDTSKITSNDTLVAFRFFLNKRDVTHTVAPMGGRDMSLKQTTQILSNLIERNSEKFQRSRDKNARLLAEINEVEATSTELAGQISALVDQGDQLNATGSELDTEYDKYRKLADKQASINAALQAEIDKMKAQLPNRDPDKNPPAPAPMKPDIEDKTRQVTQNLQMGGQHTLSNGAVIQTNTAEKNGELVGWVTITEPDGSVYKIDSPSSQGGAMQDTAKKLLKLYRDGKADKYKANDMALNDDVKSIVDAALAAITSANALTIESGSEAIDAAAKQLLQQRYALQGAHVLDQYLDQLNNADAHLVELQEEFSAGGIELPQPRRFLIPEEMPDDLKMALQNLNYVANLSNQPTMEDWREAENKLSEAGKIIYSNEAYQARYEDVFQMASYHTEQIAGALSEGTPIFITSTPDPDMPEPIPNTAEEKPDPVEPGNNAKVTGALEAIQNAAALTDASLTEIKEHLKKLREAYAILDGAGVLEQYQEMFDAASQQLGDLMQQIARG